MRHPTLALLTGVALALMPSHLRSQQPAREITVNALQVQRACLHPAKDAILKDFCALPLPSGSGNVKRDWAAWTSALTKYADYRLAESIQRHSASLPHDRISIWEIYSGLNQEQRDSAILRFSKGNRILEAARDQLSPAVKDELVQLVMGTGGAPPAQRLRPDVINAFRKEMTSDSIDLVRAFDGAMTLLPDSLRLQVLRLVAPAQDSVARVLLDSVRISMLLQGKDSKSYLSEGVRQSATNEYASAAVQPVSSRQSAQSNLVWGTTDFVVSKVQQQFEVLAVQGFLGRLCHGPEARALRNTCSVVRSNTIGISRAGTMLLRGAVSRDLEALPLTSLDYAYSEYAHRLTRRQADALQFAARITDFTLQAARGTDPILALATVADSFRVAPVDHRDALEARLSLLTRSADRLRRGTPAMRDSLQRTLRDLDRLRAEFDRATELARQMRIRADSSQVASLFLGLAALYATRFDPLRMHSVEWVGTTPRDMMRFQVIAMAANYQPRIRLAASHLAFEPWHVVPVALAIEDDLQQLRVKKNQLDAARALHPDSSGAVRQARIGLVRGAFALVDQMLFETSQVWSDASPVHQARQVSQDVQQVVFPMLDGHYSAGLLALSGQVSAYFDSVPGLDTRNRANFTRGIAFVSELADAPTADHVNAALVRLTDSGDGYVGKRRSQTLRFTLNAFGGAYGGFESANEEASTFAGIYLPVGLAVSIPWNVGRPVGGNIGTPGLFVQAVDLGALASWRLNSDEKVEQRPEVGIAQVFSPGAFLVLNISGAPLTLGYGVSWAPELRALKEGRGTETDQPSRVTAWRHGLFVAFDVPIFP